MANPTPSTTPTTPVGGPSSISASPPSSSDATTLRNQIEAQTNHVTALEAQIADLKALIAANANATPVAAPAPALAPAPAPAPEENNNEQPIPPHRSKRARRV